MTIYNPIKDTSPTPPTVVNSAANYAMGLSFTVSAPCQINGVWWWVSATQSTNASADEQIALWTVTGLGTGTYVTGSVTSAGTYTQGAWNLISFGSPITLTSGTEYIAVKGISSAASAFNYSGAASYFDSTGAGTHGYSAGPVLVYSSGASGALGSSNREPNGNGQCQYTQGTGSSGPPPNVTTTLPTSQFSATWYGLDVQIQTTVAGPVAVAYPRPSSRSVIQSFAAGRMGAAHSQ